jgi:hypothetical protein
MHAVRWILISLLLCVLFAACSQKQQPANISYFEAVGDQAKRVATVTGMLSRIQALPTPLADAEFVEEKIGDDNLGPADYRAFTMLVIAPENIAAWQAMLTPLADRPDYQAPDQPYSWWLTQDAFNALQFYAPDQLTGRANGWVAVDLEAGTIYIYSYTT